MQVVADPDGWVTLEEVLLIPDPISLWPIVPAAPVVVASADIVAVVRLLSTHPAEVWQAVRALLRAAAALSSQMTVR